jgi:geranylgeranylglycerol-phosphate geranylgeranyltransferase
MLGTRILGLFHLFRFELPLTAGVCVILGELLALGTLPTATEIVLGFLSIFFISAAALILNDYFDLESDKINAPQRPLPADLVTEQDVVLLSIVVTILGFITGCLISLEALSAVILVWVVGFLYNWRFKKAGFIGNLMVSFSVGMTFIFGGITVGKPFEIIVWFFAIIVSLIDLGEEIAADAMDIEGDRLAGSHSLALVLGSEKALKISGAIFLLVVLASSLPFLLGWLERIYLFPILLIDMVILYSTSKLLDSRIVNKRIYIRWIYLTGLVAFLTFIIIRMGR